MNELNKPPAFLIGQTLTQLESLQSRWVVRGSEEDNFLTGFIQSR